MSSKIRWRNRLTGLLVVPLLVLQLVTWDVTSAQASGSSDYSFASGAFRQAWEYYDLPVVAKLVGRSLTWGAQGFAFLNEPYQESMDHQRLVQYFDKGRMEITLVKADRNSPYYVTSGLLVRDMVAGLVQTGDNQFNSLAPANLSVAGDPINTGPTYASFRQVASLSQNNKMPDRTGAVVQETIDRSGAVGENTTLAKTYPIKYAYYDPTLGHNVAEVFWNYMQQSGLVYQNGTLVTGKLFQDAKAVFGVPITEPYWSNVIVGGTAQDVLIQLFERRVLTYTPGNPDGFKTEMGNTGLHYYNWRYGGQPYVAPWVVAGITNKSDCANLSLKLTGQDSLTLEIPAGGTVSYRLGPGNYDYEAGGCNATPYKNSLTLTPGQKFDLTFGMKKEIVLL